MHLQARTHATFFFLMLRVLALDLASCHRLSTRPKPCTPEILLARTPHTGAMVACHVLGALLPRPPTTPRGNSTQRLQASSPAPQSQQATKTISCLRVAPCCAQRVQGLPVRQNGVDSLRQTFVRARRTAAQAVSVGPPRPVRATCSGYRPADAGHGWSRSREPARGGRRVATAALPVISSVPLVGPVVNLATSPFVLFLVYTVGAARLWAGFNKTTYSTDAATKARLTALWPVLFVLSKAFRDNFGKAVTK